MAELVSASISADNTFSDEAYLEGYFNLSISGTFNATVTVQRSFDRGVTWRDMDDFTAPVEEVGIEPEYCHYRVGVKTGNYTSGTVNIRIGHKLFTQASI